MVWVHLGETNEWILVILQTTGSGEVRSKPAAVLFANCVGCRFTTPGDVCAWRVRLCHGSAVRSLGCFPKTHVWAKYQSFQHLSLPQPRSNPPPPVWEASALAYTSLAFFIRKKKLTLTLHCTLWAQITANPPPPPPNTQPTQILFFPCRFVLYLNHQIFKKKRGSGTVRRFISATVHRLWFIVMNIHSAPSSCFASR